MLATTWSLKKQYHVKGKNALRRRLYMFDYEIVYGLPYY